MAEGKSYTSKHLVEPDGTVHFQCSQNADEWRWLALSPHHPIFIQTMNFYISTECGAARGRGDQSKWSALTGIEWAIGESENSPARGLMRDTGTDDRLGFAIELYDAAETLVLRTSGDGVVFRNRDFEGWRKDAKSKLSTKTDAGNFHYASRDAVGAEQGEHALVGLLDAVDGPRATALITEANGMPPGSRFLDGSGDHVNAVHVGEVARQFNALALKKPDVTIIGGEINFKRYIEFDVPIEIVETERDGAMIAMEITQAGKLCTQIRHRIG